QDLHPIVLVIAGSGMTRESAEQLRLINHCNVEIVPVLCRDDVLTQADHFSRTDLIIDALLGTGLRGAVKEPVRSCVEMANKSSAMILSADIPTPGIRADHIL